MSDCCLTPKRNCSAISWLEQVTFTEMKISALHEIIFKALTHWNNRPLDLTLHSDTLTWFRVNQYLFLLLKAAYIAEKQPMQIFLSVVWPDRGSNPRSIPFEARTLTITPSIRFLQGIMTPYVSWTNYFNKINIQQIFFYYSSGALEYFSF